MTCTCGAPLEDKRSLCSSCGKDWRQVARPHWGWWLFFGLSLTLVALVVTPNYIRATHRGPFTSCESNLKNIGTALEMYSTDNHGLYPPSFQLLMPNYLRVVPTCPSAGRDSYGESYVHQSQPDAYSYYCSGDNHHDIGLSPNYPQYGSSQGLVTGH